MGKIKRLGKKLRLIAASKKKGAPRWADLRKYSRRARTRRISGVRTKHWRRGKLQK